VSRGSDILRRTKGGEKNIGRGERRGDTREREKPLNQETRKGKRVENLNIPSFKREEGKGKRQVIGREEQIAKSYRMKKY